MKRIEKYCRIKCFWKALKALEEEQTEVNEMKSNENHRTSKSLKMEKLWLSFKPLNWINATWLHLLAQCGTTHSRGLGKRFLFFDVQGILEMYLLEWRNKRELCRLNEQCRGPPCIGGNHNQCISLSGARQLFSNITGKLSRLFALIFSDWTMHHKTICTGRHSGSSDTVGVKTLWLFGWCLFSLFIISIMPKVSWHLADQLVQRVMLHAATAVEDD